MSRRLIIIITLSLLVLVGGYFILTRADWTGVRTNTPLSAPTLVASENPVILLYGEGYGIDVRATTKEEPVEVAVWGDGRIVWRENNNLLQGRVETTKIDELLQRLHNDGVFGTGAVEEAHYGPDAYFDVVEIRLPDRTLRLASWHEAFEANPELIATSFGITSLGGRDRDAVLAKEPAKYVRFRRIWSDIRATVKSWRPAHGGPFNGKIPVGGRG
jgi:hypothetical protein